MWILWIGISFLVAGFFLIGWMIQRSYAAETMRQRLFQSTDNENEMESAPISHASRIMRRWRWLTIVTGIVTAAVTWLLAPWPWPYTLAFGVMLTMMLWQFESWWFQKRIHRVEQQLADSIDLMVAAVKAGSSLQGALESAMENTPRPWKDELGDVIAHIRYGDEPTEVFAELRERVPLETVRLFSQTLSVNWSVGGQLAFALANVGRTIRDRIELSRRMQAMTTQARLSVISVIVVTYFIGALMWRNDPERMGEYLTSLIGQGLVTTAIILQAVGIVWIARLSTPRF